MSRNKRIARLLPALLLPLGMAAGCASPTVVEKPAPEPLILRVQDRQAIMLAYYQQIQRMSAQDLARERSNLAGMTVSPAVQMRQAMLLGHPRHALDLGRALALLDTVLKSNDPRAVRLHPLARLLSEQYLERQKLEMQLDKSTQQLKESQRREEQLQEKLEALADIERSLPSRPLPQSVRPPSSGAAQ